jgi:4-amino-4-deoxy-L-arabinose transferase-like glycosyltransferase
MPRAIRALEILAAAAAAVVLVVFASRAAALVAYPWDWSPDEGLMLDLGRRAVQDPAGLYGRSFVPFPAVYGPVLPALLAPLSGLGLRMLPAARMLALAWTAVATLAVYQLVRARTGPVAGLVAAALSLAAFDVSFWFMLVRPDGPMMALWLLAAVASRPAHPGR